MRFVRFSDRFYASKNLHAPAGTPEGRAVARIIVALGEDPTLPMPQDREAMIPPMMLCMARPIPSAGLLVCYVVRDDVVYVIGVKTVR